MSETKRDKKVIVNPYSEQFEPIREDINKIYECVPKAEVTPNMISGDPERARAMCYMRALGLSRKKIADNLGVSIGVVNDVLALRSAKELTDKYAKEIFLDNPKQMFERLLPQAVKVAYSVMMDRKEKGSTRVDAAFRFMDRALGKPEQKVEHTGSIIGEVFRRLDDIETIEIKNVDKKVDSDDKLDKVINNI